MTSAHVCAIATRRYLAHARVLWESFLQHHPDGSCSLLIVEGGADSIVADDSRVELLEPGDLGIEERELHRRATMYIQQGFADSFKPDLLRYLLAREKAPVMLLDADGRVYADLVPVLELARAHSLVLSPHNLDPLPLAGADRSERRWRDDSPEQITMRAGLMNAGLIAVAPGAEPFLDWWSERTRLRCVFDEPHALMLCQTWLTLASVLFESHLLRDPGCNVAGWNLHGRDVEWEGDAPRIDGGPLRHFHFAGSFDPERPSQITQVASLASWWATLEGRPGAVRLVREYARTLIDRGYRQARAAPLAYAQAPDGTVIEPWMRATYRAAAIEATQSNSAEPPNPFSDGSQAFFDWLLSRATQDLEAQAAAVSENTLASRELSAALLDGAKMLARIEQLEASRDENARWAQRVSDELEITAKDRDRQRRELLAKIEQLSDELAAEQTMIDSVLQSPSWRLTRPLRAAKGIFARTRAGRSTAAN